MKFKEPPVPVQEGKSSTLPEGFFDSVDADHRARGLEPPKLDIKYDLTLLLRGID